jgi:hypothetical protein
MMSQVGWVESAHLDIKTTWAIRWAAYNHHIWIWQISIYHPYTISTPKKYTNKRQKTPFFASENTPAEACDKRYFLIGCSIGSIFIITRYAIHNSANIKSSAVQ